MALAFSVKSLASLAPNASWLTKDCHYYSQSFSTADDLIDIALAGHYSHGEDSKSKFMTHFLDKLPDWVDPTAWVSTYEKYTF